MAQERRECEATSLLVLPCSGGSNVGQMANAAAIEMTHRGQANMYCLAGIGAHVADMVDSAAHADYCITIDGCQWPARARLWSTPKCLRIAPWWS